ncbi:MAG: hypothetical protein IT462_11440 [Planctomycetes bacterium]|nr:hypothetical protein [Planctomycetota bacterium]
MHRFLLIALTLLFANSLAALTINADITSASPSNWKTWTASDSPYVLAPASGQTIKIRDSVTVTIDTSGGAVEVELSQDCDLQIGNGSGDGGDLVISPSGGDVTFKIRDNGNIIVNAHGSITFSNVSYDTSFTRFGTGSTDDQPGALIFDADQTKQSALLRCNFSYMGNDNQNAALYIKSSATYVPSIQNISFSSCIESAIRMDGNGVNVLKAGNIGNLFNVSNTSYVLYLNAAVSTAESIRFPDVTTPATPEARLDGTCQVGDTTNTSHWRFGDGYTVKCSSGSKVQVVNGSVWGTAESKPKFQAISGSAYNGWGGFIDDTGDEYGNPGYPGKPNVFGDIGPFAYLEIWNAVVGVELFKGTSYVPVSGVQTLWRFPGLTIKKCDIGIRVRTFIDTGSGDAGYSATIEGADIGGPDSTDDCQSWGIYVDHGRTVFSNCSVRGCPNEAIHLGTTTVNLKCDVAIRDCRLTDSTTSPGLIGIFADSCQGAFPLLIERTVITGYHTGISFFQTSTGSYTPSRSLTLKGSYVSGFAYGTDVSATGLSAEVQTAATCALLVEDCTVSGTNKTGTGTARGFWLKEVRSGSSFVVRRTNIDANADFGVDIVSATNNTCQYTFDQCSFTGNGDGGTNEGGIRDARAQNAKVVAFHCTFAGNSPRGVSDTDATAEADATYCYWNHSSGPDDAGPGTGDAVSTNVDFDPFLGAAYFSSLLGGSPASASSWDVKEDANINADNLHVVQNRPYFAWTFASDFSGNTQASYEIDVSGVADFSTDIRWDGAKTDTSSQVPIRYPATGGAILALNDGTTYYARIRLWSQDAVVGPWGYLTFRMNSAPQTVTNGSPAGGGTIGDATPQLQWDYPTDAEEDPLFFYIQLDTSTNFNTGALRTIDTSGSLGTGGALDYSLDGGTTWLPAPYDGIPKTSSITPKVRLTLPHLYPNGLGTLTTTTTWYWRAKANDRFELSASYSSNFSFYVSRKYNLSGRLTTVGGGNPGSGEEVLVLLNGSAASKTGSSTTNGSGDFTFQMTSDAKVGDALVLYLNRAGGSPNKCARVVHFTGADISGLDLREERVYVQQGLVNKAVTNADFAGDSGVDVDIPWSETSGAIVFDFGSGTSGEIYVLGEWSLTGSVTATANNPLVRTETTGTLTTSGQAVTAYDLEVDGILQITGGSLFTVTNSADCDNTLRVFDSTLRLQKTSTGINLTINSLFEARDSTFDVNTGGVSTLTFDGAYPAYSSAVNCTGCVFSKVGVVFETDALLVQFGNSTFKDGISTRHIYWKSSGQITATTMRGIQFDYALTQGSQYNVQADSSAKVLTMLACGGIRAGEGYDGGYDANVLWSPLPPKDVKFIAGDTRIRLEWTQDDQTELANAGYNVYSYDGQSIPPSTKLNGSLITTNSYNITGLTNGTTYTLYVTCVDTNPNPDLESDPSVWVIAAPIAGSIALVAPSTGVQGTNAAITIVGQNTHWDGSATWSVSGTGVTENDLIVLSPCLALGDLTINAGASATGRTLTMTRNNVWTIAAYDEVKTSAYTIFASASTNRPIASFTSPSADANVRASGAGAPSWTIGLSFNANSGASIDTASFEFYTARKISHNGGDINDPPTNIASTIFESISASAATATIEQAIGAGTQNFYDGEYVVSARIGNTAGLYSEWVSRRFYVDGAGANFVKVPDSGGLPVVLKQGDVSRTISLSGTSLSASPLPDFGTDVTVHSATVTGLGSGLDVVVSVDQLATCGPREFQSNGGAKKGWVIVEYPTNIIPTTNTTNPEPSRNPAIGGVNVFLVSGAFFKSETDIATRGRMMGISWSRFYRSDITYNGPLGFNWVGHYFQRAICDSGSGDIWWYTPDGRKEVFSDVTGGFSNPAGVYVTATRETTHNTITLTDRNGMACVFDAQGRLWKCVDRNGNKTECTYNYAGQLTTITDDRARTYNIIYHTHGRVDKVQDKVWNTGTPREVEYEYNSRGDLCEQKAPTTDRYDGDPLPRITYSYRYNTTHRLTSCINPREFAQGSNPTAYLENEYQGSKVINQRLGEPDQWVYLRYVSSTLVRVVDRRGLRTDYTIDASGRTTAIKRYTNFWAVDTDVPINDSTISSTGSKVRSSDPTSFDSNFFYNSNNEIIGVVNPRGNRTTYQYVTGAQQTSGTATYCSNAVLTKTGAGWTTDALAGMTLRMGSSDSDYRYYPIVSNTSTTITVNSVFNLQTDGWGASAYAVFDGSNASQTSGTATSCSANILTKSAAGWTTNAWAGMSLRMGTNVGNYKFYAIVSNTSTTITVDSTFSLSGDGWGASSYAVFVHNSDAMAAGNVVKVFRTGLSGETNLVTQYTYEPRYQFVKRAKNPRGYTTTYTYDYEDTSSATDKFAGNLIKVTAPSVTLGQPSAQTIETRTTYNLYGQPVSSVDAEGNVTHYRYYSGSGHDGFLYQSVSAYGVLDITSEFEYDNVGNLVASWSPRAFEPSATKDNFKTSFEVNELNQTWHSQSVVQHVGDDDRVDVYKHFDANGNVTHVFREYVTDIGGEKALPSSSQAVDPAWFVGEKASTAMAATWVESNTTYNLLNYPTQSTIDAVAGSTITRLSRSTVYDANYNVISSISPLGNRSGTIFDERDMVFQSISGQYSSVSATYQSDYDLNGNLVTSKDANGNTSTFTSDGFDRNTISQDPAGNQRKSYFDANSNVTKTEAFQGSVSSGVLLTRSESFFDEADRTYKSQSLALDENGNAMGDGLRVSTTLLDKNSRTISSTDDNGVSSYQFYDAANRTLYTRDATGNETYFTYSLAGSITKSTYREINLQTGDVEVSHESSFYDYVNRRTRFEDRRYNASSKDTHTEAKYDGWGRVTESKDAAGTATSTTFDLLSRAVRSTRKPDTGDATKDIVTDTFYDDDSRVTMTSICENPGTWTNWQDTSFEYDARGRTTTVRRPDGSINTFSYDANSNQTGWVDRLGTRVTDTFDSRNLIANRTITFAAGSTVKGTTYESYDFDALGRITSCSNYDGTRMISSSTWTYNSLSMPVSLTQTMTMSTGTSAGTYTTTCEYDASGFNTAIVYPSGRRIENTRDNQGRLSSTTDVSTAKQLAAYVYAGSGRLALRIYGNGTRSTFSYEAAGCGCGGFSSYCEKAEHTFSSEVLYSHERRYSVDGDVLTERCNHEGAMGLAYRYDKSHRLTEVYYGVDMYNTIIDTYKSSNPSTFPVKRIYNLDQRGNRSGSSAVNEVDSSAATRNATDFTVGNDANDTENLYTSVDGDSFTYDAAKQITYDPSTGLYYAYDYKGQLILEDNSSDFSSPQRKYSYDNVGRRKAEEVWYDSTNYSNTITTDFPQRSSCGCSNSGIQPASERTLNAAGSEISKTDYIYGQGVRSPGSGGGSHPATAFALPSGGGMPGSSLVVYIPDGEPFYVHEGADGWMLGNTTGNAGSAGWRRHEIHRNDSGAPMKYDVMLDIKPGNISKVRHIGGATPDHNMDWPSTDEPDGRHTKIEITFGLGANEYDRRELRISRPGHATDRYISAPITLNTTSYIIVWDPNSTVYDALVGLTQGFTVLDFLEGNLAIPATIYEEDYNTPAAPGQTRYFIKSTFNVSSIDTTYYICPDRYNAPTIWYPVVGISSTDNCVMVAHDHRIGAGPDEFSCWFSKKPLGPLAPETATQAGVWEGVSGTDTDPTEFWDNEAQFKSFMIGWTLIPDVENPVYLTISAVSSNGLVLTVTGKYGTTSGVSKRYRVVPPLGVNGKVGGICDPTRVKDGDLDSGGPRYPWAAGYRYDAPVAGCNISGTIYGAQSGTNLKGQYYCWNRIYSPYLGRWTTPDPAASPSWNLWDYCSGVPVARSDPTGLWFTLDFRPAIKDVARKSTNGDTITETYYLNKQTNEYVYSGVKRTGNVVINGNKFPYEMADCECCAGVTGDWMRDRVVGAITKIRRLSILADQLKEKHDKTTITSIDDLDVDSPMRKMLANFGTADYSNFNFETGEGIVSMRFVEGIGSAVNRIQDVLGKMYWWTRDPGIKMTCYTDANDGRGGWAEGGFIFGAIYRWGDRVHLNCDGTKHGADVTENTIVHEVSHLAALTFDDDEHGGKQNNAHEYEILAGLTLGK